MKIGVSISLTGNASPDSRLVMDGYKIFESQVNNVKGGVTVGGKKYKVQLVPYDDKSDRDTSVKLVEKLIADDKVDFMLAPWGSGNTNATSTVAEKHKKIMVAPLAASDPLYARGYKYLFGIFPLASQGARGVIEMIPTMNPRPKTIAIVSPDDMFPLMCAEGAKAAAEKQGLNIVLYEKYPPEVTDFAPLLGKIKNANPDVLFSTAEAGDAVRFVRQMKELRVSPGLFSLSDSVVVPDYVNNLKADAEYTFGTTWWTPRLNYKDPLFGDTQSFVAAFKKQFGYDPTHDTAASAAAGEVLMLAAEKAGTLDTDKVRDALAATDVETLFMRIKFDANGANQGGEYNVLQVLDGRLQVVFPKARAERDSKYPAPKWENR